MIEIWQTFCLALALVGSGLWEQLVERHTDPVPFTRMIGKGTEYRHVAMPLPPLATVSPTYTATYVPANTLAATGNSTFEALFFSGTDHDYPVYREDHEFDSFEDSTPAADSSRPYGFRNIKTSALMPANTVCVQLLVITFCCVLVYRWRCFICAAASLMLPPPQPHALHGIHIFHRYDTAACYWHLDNVNIQPAFPTKTESITTAEDYLDSRDLMVLAAGLHKHATSCQHQLSTERSHLERRRKLYEQAIQQHESGQCRPAGGMAQKAHDEAISETESHATFKAFIAAQHKDSLIAEAAVAREMTTKTIEDLTAQNAQLSADNDALRGLLEVQEKNDGASTRQESAGPSHAELSEALHKLSEDHKASQSTAERQRKAIASLKAQKKGCEQANKRLRTAVASQALKLRTVDTARHALQVRVARVARKFVAKKTKGNGHSNTIPKSKSSSKCEETVEQSSEILMPVQEAAQQLAARLSTESSTPETSSVVQDHIGNNSESESLSGESGAVAQVDSAETLPEPIPEGSATTSATKSDIEASIAYQAPAEEIQLSAAAYQQDMDIDDQSERANNSNQNNVTEDIEVPNADIGMPFNLDIPSNVIAHPYQNYAMVSPQQSPQLIAGGDSIDLDMEFSEQDSLQSRPDDHISEGLLAPAIHPEATNAYGSATDVAMQEAPAEQATPIAAESSDVPPNPSQICHLDCARSTESPSHFFCSQCWDVLEEDARNALEADPPASDNHMVNSETSHQNTGQHGDPNIQQPAEDGSASQTSMSSEANGEQVVPGSSTAPEEVAAQQSSQNAVSSPNQEDEPMYDQPDANDRVLHPSTVPDRADTADAELPQQPAHHSEDTSQSAHAHGDDISFEGPSLPPDVCMMCGDPKPSDQEYCLVCDSVPTIARDDSENAPELPLAAHAAASKRPVATEPQEAKSDEGGLERQSVKPKESAPQNTLNTGSNGTEAVNIHRRRMLPARSRRGITNPLLARKKAPATGMVGTRPSIPAKSSVVQPPASDIYNAWRDLENDTKITNSKHDDEEWPRNPTKTVGAAGAAGVSFGGSRLSNGGAIVRKTCGKCKSTNWNYADNRCGDCRARFDPRDLQPVKSSEPGQSNTTQSTGNTSFKSASSSESANPSPAREVRIPDDGASTMDRPGGTFQYLADSQRPSDQDFGVQVARCTECGKDKPFAELSSGSVCSPCTLSHFKRIHKEDKVKKKAEANQ